MQRLRTVIILALAWSFLSSNRPAIAQQASSTFSLELRFANPAMPNAPDVVLTVRIGAHESKTLPIEAWGLTQYLNSWRDRAIDLLIKQLHMA
jgi:hypothetical protein